MVEVVSCQSRGEAHLPRSDQGASQAREDGVRGVGRSDQVATIATNWRDWRIFSLTTSQSHKLIPKADLK